MPKVPSPLFIDPIYNSPADPMIIRNEQTGKYYLFYTQRRAAAFFDNGVAYCYGTKIGVAESEDGAYWFYRGVLDLDFEFGTNTFWAPEIIWDEKSGLYHMYVAYIQGLHSCWAGDTAIMHYTSPDLLYWKHQGRLELEGSRVIDPCLFKLADGSYRMWYKDDDSHTRYADSEDLYNWVEKGFAANDNRQEGANVFELGGKYWLIADEWNGLAVYSSDDLSNFERQEGEYLLTGNGNRYRDTGVGRHANVLVHQDRAFIVYFTHYNDDGNIEAKKDHAPSVVQLAELEIVDGKLVCDRNKEFEIDLRAGV